MLELDAINCEITCAPTIFPNIVADSLWSSVMPTYNILSNLFCKIYKIYHDCNHEEETYQRNNNMTHNTLFNHENLQSLPWQLQAQMPQESGTFVHNDVLHALPLNKSCLLVLQPVKPLPENWKLIFLLCRGWKMYYDQFLCKIEWLSATGTHIR